ncbi:MAG: DUF2332 family protein [Pseudomonadota bacterium]
MTSALLPKAIADAFAQQARACASLGSPFTAAICQIVADHGLPESKTQARLAAWEGDPQGTGTAPALRLTGALHNLVLRQADRHLAAVYPPNQWSEETLQPAVFDAITRYDAMIHAFLDSPPQTNETGRAAILLPALLTLAQRHALPVNLLELGASAGLNQNLQRFYYDYDAWRWGDPSSGVHLPCEWRGNAFQLSGQTIDIASRKGCDIAPVAIETDEDRQHLVSYVWADQTARLARTQAALAIAKNHPPTVEKSGAADWLEKGLADAPTPSQWRVVFHTIMWQYMPTDEQARAAAAIQQAGAAASTNAPLGWVRFEADGEKGSAGLYVTVWDGTERDGQDMLLARGDFHGRWIEWRG